MSSVLMELIIAENANMQNTPRNLVLCIKQYELATL